MITVSVEYYSIFCAAAGFCRREALQLESGRTLWDLVNIIDEKYGQCFWIKVLDHDNKLRITAWVLVNGKKVNLPGFNEKLNNGDKILFSTPLLVGG
ncbi:MAG: MoaD/ThiS family protein [Firmicutes bacterium]|nr:MoaD/ThiS family protein [Bacillota bacterium]